MAIETSEINLSFRYTDENGRANFNRVPGADSEDSPYYGKTYATANVYTIEGVNGGRPVSIMGVVMALCLNRAISMESRIIETMREMESNSDKLERLTRIEEELMVYYLTTQSTFIQFPNRVFSTEEKDVLRQLGFPIQTFNRISIIDFFAQMEEIGDSFLDGSEQKNKYDQLMSSLRNEFSDGTETGLRPVTLHYPDCDFLKDLGINMYYVDKSQNGPFYVKWNAEIKEIEQMMDSLNSFSQQTMIDLQSLTNKRDQSYDMASNIIKSLNTTLMAIANNL